MWPHSNQGLLVSQLLPDCCAQKTPSGKRVSGHPTLLPTVEVQADASTPPNTSPVHCIRHSSSRESSYTAHLLRCWWDCSPITNTLRWSYLPFPEVTRWKKKLGKDQPGPQFSLQFLHYSHHSKLLTFWNLKTFSPWAEIPS